jgi:hypothetical protein
LTDDRWAGDPVLQPLIAAARVEALVRARGFDPDMWDGEIERVKAFRFD